MSNVRSNMRAVMRTQAPLLSIEAIWKDKYVLLRELMEFMTPLFILIRAGQSGGSQSRYYVVVPPDEQLSDFITEGEGPHSGSFAARSIRCAQSAVRAHILHGSEPNHLSSLLGFSAVVDLAQSAVPPAEGEQALFAALGTVSVADAHGNTMTATIQAVERLTAGNLPMGSTSNGIGCTLLFVDKAVYSSQRQRPKQPLTAKLLAQKCRMSMIPVWQRLPNSAASFLATAGPKDISSSALLARFQTDEKSFRTLISDFAAEKVETLDTAEDKRRVALLVDRAMMLLETEVTMFQSSYVCMAGYEAYIVAKVLQVVESAVETALDVRSETDWVEVEEKDELWTDDEKEQMVVSVHTVVSSAVAPKVLLHWESVYHNEDFAFHHACCSLQRTMTLCELLRVPGIEKVSPSHFDSAVAVVSVLNSQTLSVFSMMRVMETTISLVVELLQTCGVLSDVTADLAIPLIVFVIVQTRPTCLPSRIKYILDMSIPSLEMSSLGYALTTFEAAAAHVLEEYGDHVAKR
jgi:hypothetical protein